MHLSSFTLAKWNEGRMCTAFNPLLRKRAKMLHAVGLRISECVVHAACRLRHSQVVHAEVADVKFVNAQVADSLQGGRAVFIPTWRLGPIRVEIGDAALGSVDARGRWNKDRW